MATCKKCEKKFHACSSCGLSNDLEYNYCSESCWENSEEYLNDVKNVDELLVLLSENEPNKNNHTPYEENDMFFCTTYNDDGTVTIPIEIFNSRSDSAFILNCMLEFFDLEKWDKYADAMNFVKSQNDS